LGTIYYGISSMMGIELYKLHMCFVLLVIKSSLFCIIPSKFRKWGFETKKTHQRIIV